MEQRSKTGPSLNKGKMVLPGSAHVISAPGSNMLSVQLRKITEGIFMNSQTFRYSRNQGEDGSA